MYPFVETRYLSDERGGGKPAIELRQRWYPRAAEGISMQFLCLLHVRWPSLVKGYDSVVWLRTSPAVPRMGWRSSAAAAAVSAIGKSSRRTMTAAASYEDDFCGTVLRERERGRGREGEREKRQYFQFLDVYPPAQCRRISSSSAVSYINLFKNFKK